ncbi:molybdopterin synthase sulfur carrier subunit [Mycobacterium sp. IS-1742]|uniref:MoaD/ThiS family protein n=1 Tax=Mycobacterium sp. IS-1742 TaxID=1772285 RepID=UPI00073FD296|nr:MoaD/ThiS family protein [Mycobacterium sp. IS-1742]KUI24135.1 molybdopterin synthase sulfur carrier subunit [Mycobacterium sp. IS-1742]
MSTTTTVRVAVRYFAAARAAAGTDAEQLTIPTGTTVQALVDELACRNPELKRVLARCSYLCDGVAVRDTGRALSNAQTLDVLPPFAGG